MTTAYEVIITAIATSTINGLEGVIKRVDFVLRGTKSNHIYELPESVSLANPDPQSFKVLANVTEADVITWVNSNHSSIEGLKVHVDYMLDKQISQGELIPTPLPWATE